MLPKIDISSKFKTVGRYSMLQQLSFYDNYLYNVSDKHPMVDTSLFAMFLKTFNL